VFFGCKSGVLCEVWRKHTTNKCLGVKMKEIHFICFPQYQWSLHLTGFQVLDWAIHGSHCMAHCAISSFALRVWQSLHPAACLWIFVEVEDGSLNVPIEHHPTIWYMVYNGYFSRWCPIFPKWDSYQPLLKKLETCGSQWSCHADPTTAELCRATSRLRYSYYAYSKPYTRAPAYFVGMWLVLES